MQRAAIWQLGVLAALAAFSMTSAVAAKQSPNRLNAHSRYARGGMTEGARQYYAMVWGVDDFSAKLTESGQLVRFSYRVVDAKKAALLQDRAASPALIDEAAHVALQVPNMEKVGPLRQSMPAQDGKVYWIAFSNKGFPVKKGQRVSVAIGSFKIDGLVVQP